MYRKRKLKFIQGPSGPPGPMGPMGTPGRDYSEVPRMVEICRYVIAGLIVACFAFAFFLVGTSIAHAEYMYGKPADPETHWHHDGHSKYHDIYKTWCQPGNPKPCPKPNSCCDAREEISKDGKVTLEGHCYWTDAELRPSNDPTIKYLVWWVLFDTGKWEEVPEGKYLKEKNPDHTGHEAHVCENPTHVILCFLPPTGTN